MNLGDSKISNIEGDLIPCLPNGDDTRVPVDIWDRRSWRYQGVQVKSALHLLS